MEKKLMGLRVDIFRSDYSCELNLLNDKKEATLCGPGIPEIFEPDETAPAVFLSDKSGRVSAYPEGHEYRWYMFGGSFIFTSDSRFPAKHPIHLHDRWEGQLV